MNNPYLPKLKSELTVSPPQFIIMDGYTKICYRSFDNNLEYLLNNMYLKEKEIKGSQFLVTIYKLNK